MVTQTQMRNELKSNKYWKAVSFQQKGNKQVSYKGKKYDIAVVNGIDTQTGLKCQMALARFRDGFCYKVAETKVYDKDNKLVRHETPYLSWNK
jgi:hypothetical protein